MKNYCLSKQGAIPRKALCAAPPRFERPPQVKTARVRFLTVTVHSAAEIMSSHMSSANSPDLGEINDFNAM